MKTRALKALVAVFLLFAALQYSFARDASPQVASADIRMSLESSIGQVVRLKTSGGGEFQGRLLSVGDDRVEIENGEGQILQIAAARIAEVLIIDPSRSRDTYFQDAAANKLILMPVGFGMDPGEFHVADQEIIIVSMSYGVSRNFSLWGALSLPGALLNARFSASIGDSIGISAGSFAGIMFTDWGSVIAIPYIIASFGSPNHNFTVGLGAPYFTNALFVAAETEQRYAGGVVPLAGKIVLSRTASIVTENWALALWRYQDARWQSPEFYFVPAVVFRIAGSRFSWDIGVTMPFGYMRDYDYDEATDTSSETFKGFRLRWLLEQPIPIPILSFTYRVQ